MTDYYEMEIIPWNYITVYYYEMEIIIWNYDSTFSPHPSRPPPKLPKISVVNKSQNEEEAFELRSQVEEICQYWSVCL